MTLDGKYIVAAGAAVVALLGAALAAHNLGAAMFVALLGFALIATGIARGRQ
jgi:hypothetical protein